MTPDQVMGIFADIGTGLALAVVGTGRGIEAPLYLLVVVQTFALVRSLVVDLIVERRHQRVMRQARQAEADACYYVTQLEKVVRRG